MAKKAKMKLSVTAPSAPALATKAAKEEDEWRVKDDAEKVRRYAELARDKDRHKKVLDHIRNEHQSMMSLLGAEQVGTGMAPDNTVQPKYLARSGRKLSTRVKRSKGRSYGR